MVTRPTRLHNQFILLAKLTTKTGEIETVIPAFHMQHFLWEGARLNVLHRIGPEELWEMWVVECVKWQLMNVSAQSCQPLKR